MNCYESIDQTIRLLYAEGKLTRVEILQAHLVSFEVLQHFLVLYESELDHGLFLSKPHHLEILNS